MQRQVESWHETQITDTQATLIFYSAFVDGKLDGPKSRLSYFHRLYYRAGVSRVFTPDDVEPIEHFYERVQEARSGSAD